MAIHGKNGPCLVHRIHVKISDVDSRAVEMIEVIRDTSWLEPLKAVERKTFSATSRRTVDRLVEQIRNRTADEVSSEFGEYLISVSAQAALSDHCKHIKVPLAELLKEKVSGNPGFDFHTESHIQLIAFGEAKYSGTSNPYQDALEQIARFIRLEKDSAELAILQNFVSEIATNNFLDGKKAYAAAFSVNAKNPSLIIDNSLKSPHIDDLLIYGELYIIGVEIDA